MGFASLPIERAMTPQTRLRDWQDRLREPSLSAVLGLQVLVMFVIGPLTGTSLTFPRIIPLFVIVIALVSIFVVAQGSAARRVTMAAFGATVAGSALRTFFPTPATFLMVESIAILVFIATVTVVIARTVMGGGRVTLHRIQGAIAIYLNIAMAFAFIDNLILRHWPAAYSNLGPRVDDRLGEMLYFSLTTITTTGYGDIVPIHPVARGMANLESVTGQLYIAITISILVGRHVSHRREVEEKSATGD
jgi:hypothetical protein